MSLPAVNSFVVFGSVLRLDKAVSTAETQVLRSKTPVPYCRNEQSQIRKRIPHVQQTYIIDSMCRCAIDALTSTKRAMRRSRCSSSAKSESSGSTGAGAAAQAPMASLGALSWRTGAGKESAWSSRCSGSGGRAILCCGKSKTEALSAQQRGRWTGVTPA
jgi:hypothetical protein